MANYSSYEQYQGALQSSYNAWQAREKKIEELRKQYNDINSRIGSTYDRAEQLRLNNQRKYLKESIKVQQELSKKYKAQYNDIKIGGTGLKDLPKQVPKQQEVDRVKQLKQKEGELLQQGANYETRQQYLSGKISYEQASNQAKRTREEKQREEYRKFEVQAREYAQFGLKEGYTPAEIVNRAQQNKPLYTKKMPPVLVGGYSGSLISPKETAARVEANKKSDVEARLALYESKAEEINLSKVKAAERAEKNLDKLRVVPFLGGDSFLQKTGRNYLFGYAYGVPTAAEQVYIAGKTIGFTGAALFDPKSPINKQDVYNEYARAAKQTPKEVAQGFNPKTPEGLANIALVATPLLLETPKAAKFIRENPISGKRAQVKFKPAKRFKGGKSKYSGGVLVSEGRQGALRAKVVQTFERTSSGVLKEMGNPDINIRFKGQAKQLKASKAYPKGFGTQSKSVSGGKLQVLQETKLRKATKLQLERRPVTKLEKSYVNRYQTGTQNVLLEKPVAQQRGVPQRSKVMQDPRRSRLESKKIELATKRRIELAKVRKVKESSVKSFDLPKNFKYLALEESKPVNTATLFKYLEGFEPPKSKVAIKPVETQVRSVSVKQNELLSQGTKEKQAIFFNEKQSNKNTQGIAQVQRQGLVSSVSQITAPKYSMLPKYRFETNNNQAQKQYYEQSRRSANIVPSKVVSTKQIIDIPRISEPKRTTKRVVVSRRPVKRTTKTTSRQNYQNPFLPRPQNQKREQRQQGFNVLIRKSGRWVKETKRALSYEQALNFGAFKVGTSAAASFKLEESSDRDLGFFGGTGKLADFGFRKGIFVEKRERRIKSRGEKKEITLKGIFSSKRRKKRK